MNESQRISQPIQDSLPAGWYLIDRFDGDHAVLLDFQRDDDLGPRVTGFGTTFEEAVRFGLTWMRRYDERAHR